MMEHNYWKPAVATAFTQLIDSVKRHRHRHETGCVVSGWILENLITFKKTCCHQKQLHNTCPKTIATTSNIITILQFINAECFCFCFIFFFFCYWICICPNAHRINVCKITFNLQVLKLKNYILRVIAVV